MNHQISKIKYTNFCLRQALDLKKKEETYIVIGKVFLYNADIPGAVAVYKEAVQ